MLFFRLYFVDINVVCKLDIRFGRKKVEQVCQRHCFWEHICTLGKISGLKIKKSYKKVILNADCRTGYKFKYYQQKNI